MADHLICDYKDASFDEYDYKDAAFDEYDYKDAAFDEYDYKDAAFDEYDYKDAAFDEYDYKDAAFDEYDYKDAAFDEYNYKDASFDDYLHLNLNWNLGLDLNEGWKDDVINKLPSDPFEMNVSNGCTIIRGWVQEVVDDDNKGGFFLFNEKSKKVENLIKKDGNLIIKDGDEVGEPHDAMFLALGHLGIRDLLSVERVCKLFRDAVRYDPLLWRNVSIDQPVGESFTDDSLLRITNRANGSLQSLSLVKCLKITDMGIKNVFQKNLGLIKLNVVGCNGISMEGLLNSMRSFKGGGIKRLRIGGLHNITIEQFQELNKILSLNNQTNPGPPKPRFFHGSQLYLSLDDNRTIDIEACPKCHQLRQVYDCPAASCGGKHNNCRACTLCIPRCTSCGCCFNERDYIETFCLDLLCLDCLTRFLRYPDCDNEDISIRRFHQRQHQQACYHFCLYG